MLKLNIIIATPRHFIQKPVMQTLKESGKLLMGVLCALQPWVVKETTTNIYHQEHSIMNNALYGRRAQRIHAQFFSLPTSHWDIYSTFNGSLYSLGLVFGMCYCLVLQSSKPVLLLRIFTLIFFCLGRRWLGILNHYRTRPQLVPLVTFIAIVTKSNASFLNHIKTTDCPSLKKYQ